MLELEEELEGSWRIADLAEMTVNKGYTLIAIVNTYEIRLRFTFQIVYLVNNCLNEASTNQNPNPNPNPNTRAIDR